MIETVVFLTLFKADTYAPRAPESRHTATASSVFAVQNRSSITGSVYNQQRRPIQNLRVELLDEVDGLIRSTYTDSSGRYYFTSLSPGVFQVRVLSGGTEYEGRTERVQIQGSLLGRGGQSEQIDFVLSYKDKNRATVSPGATPGSVFVQEVPDEARRAYERALNGLDVDKPKDDVLAALQKAVALFPEYYAALDLLGQEYIKRANYKAAQSVLIKAVAVNQRSFSSWYSLGYTQYKLRLLSPAVESLTKSAQLNPKSVNTFLVLGTIERLQKQWSAAEEHLKQAKSLSKKTLPEIHWQLALLYNQMGRNAEAADELDLFLKAQPDSRDAEKIRNLIADLRKKK